MNDTSIAKIPSLSSNVILPKTLKTLKFTHIPSKMIQLSFKWVT